MACRQGQGSQKPGSYSNTKGPPIWSACAVWPGTSRIDLLSQDLGRAWDWVGRENMERWRLLWVCSWGITVFVPLHCRSVLVRLGYTSHVVQLAPLLFLLPNLRPSKLRCIVMFLIPFLLQYGISSLPSQKGNRSM